MKIPSQAENGNIKFLKLFLLIAVFCGFSSCHKSKNGVASPVSVNVVHAIAGANPIIPVFGASGPLQYFHGSQKIGYGNSQLYSPLSGQNSISIFQSSDTSQSLFAGLLNLNAGGIYSLFLSGDTIKPDTLFVQDAIPVYLDSSVGIRVANLSQGSMSISVNLQGNPPTQTEFADLGYKQISEFKRYSATNSIPGSYTFEIRDQSSGNLLATYTWNYVLTKNNTLLIAGTEDPNTNTPIQAFILNNF